MLRVLLIIMAFGLFGCGEAGKKATTTTTTHTEVISNSDQNVVIRVTAAPGTQLPASSQTTRLEGLVIDDPIINADVKVYALDNTLLETTVTGDDGDFVISINTSLLTDGYIIIATGGTMNGQVFTGELKAIYTAEDDPKDANLTIMSTLIAKLAETQAGANLIEKRDNAIAHLVHLGLLANNDYHKTDTELLNEDSARIDIAVIGVNAWVDGIITDIVDGELNATNMNAFANSNGGILAINVSGQQEISIWPGTSIQLSIDILATTNNVESSLENAPTWVSLSGNNITVSPTSTVEPGSYRFNLVAGSSLSSAKKTVLFTVEILERVLLLSGHLSSIAGEISNDDNDIRIAVAASKLSQNYAISFYGAATGKDTVRFALESVPEMPDDERIALDVSKPSSEMIIRNHIEPSVGVAAARPTLQNKASNSSGSNFYSSLVPSVCRTAWKDGNNDGHRFNYVWNGEKADFVDLNPPTVGNYFFKTGGDPRVFENRWLEDEDERCRSTLRASVAENDISLNSTEAVLFIHGFISSGKPGGIEGDEEYFGAFPKVVSQVNLNGRTFSPFLFSWQTNQRFEDAASDLALAIIKLTEETKKQVHIVAHSFGGVLVRTLVQGMATNGLGSDFATRNIASITTIGSPHSGILSADNGTSLDFGGQQIEFPQGTDDIAGTAINLCTAITCYQLGEDWNLLHSNNAEKYYHVKMSQDYGLSNNRSIKGYLAYELAKNIGDYPSIPTQVLMGVIHDNEEIKCVVSATDPSRCNMTYFFEQGEHMGDGLISLKGQRFVPYNKETHPKYSYNYADSVEEHLLNLYNDKSLQREYMTDLSHSFFDDIDYDNDWEYAYSLDIPLKASGNSISGSLYSHGFVRGLNHRTGQYSNGALDLVNIKPNPNFLPLQGSPIRMLTEVGLNESECSASTLPESRCEHPSWLYVKSFLKENVAQSITVQQRISVTGRVQEASQNSAQSQSQSERQLQAKISSTTAIVNVYNDGSKVGSQEVLMGESYEVSVPFVANSPYRVEVVPERGSSLMGTVSRTITTASSYARSSLNFGIIDLISNALNKNTLNILLIDATTGQSLTGFDYVMSNYNGDFVEGGSEASSQHLFTEKRFGRYHIEVSKLGYSSTLNTCTILPLINNQCTFVLSPERTNASGEFTAVLIWDVNPRDLDSHLIKYNTNGSEQYHIFYSNKSVTGSADRLDLDDTSSYGPETITIDEIDNSAHYIYAVHHFAGSGSISSSSQAKVSLQTATENMLLNAPVSGSGIWWKVFEIINGQIIPCTSGCIMNSQPTTAAKSTQTISDDKWLADMEADLVVK